MKKIGIKIGVLLLILGLGMSFPTYAEASAPPVTRNLILVNKNNPVDLGYKPTLEVDLSQFAPVKNPSYVPQMVGDAFGKMVNDMKAQGIEDLYIANAYRSVAFQTSLFNNEVNHQMATYGMSEVEAKTAAATMVAMPGTSEHQTGFAIDLATTGDTELTESFENTKAGKFIKEKGYQYGFIVRYPKDKEKKTGVIYEPWHIRYVGIPYAEFLTKEKLTLEEFYEKLEHKGNLSFEISNKGKKQYYKVSEKSDVSKVSKNTLEISENNKGSYVMLTKEAKPKKTTKKKK